MTKFQERAEALARAGEGGAAWADIGSLKRDEYRAMAEAEYVFGDDAYRAIQLPAALSFADLFDYIGEWTHDAEQGNGAPRMIGDNTVGPFATIDLGQLGGERHRSIAVTATDAVIEVLAPRIVTDDDHLSFRLIGHESTGRVLVTCEHSYIIGSHWLAYIDPATIPVPKEVV